MILTPSLIKVIVFAILIGGFFGVSFHMGYKYRLGIETQNLLEMEENFKAELLHELSKNADLAKKLEEEKRKTKVVTKEVIRYVRKEIEKPVYRECVVPDSGVSKINDAAEQFNNQRKTDSSSKHDDTVR
jgi:hypothetical protein